MMRSKLFNLLSLALIMFCLISLLFLASCKKSTTPVSSASIKPTPEPYEDLILYTSGGQLFTTNLSSDQITKLKNTGKSNWFPSVSPDKSQVAFWSDISGSYELWRYAFSEAKATRLTFFNDNHSSPELQNFNVRNAPAWSPKGDLIAFSYMGKIWIINKNGYNLETLIPAGQNYSPSWSPDGKLLAYISSRQQTRNLYLRRIQTGEEWAVTAFPATHHVGGPVWSPDGKKIAFSLSIFEAVDVWIINHDGTGLKRLTKDGASNAPTWSPDGLKMAFSSGRQDPYRWEIWVMNADGTGQFSVSRNGGFSPAWLRIDHVQKMVNTIDRSYTAPVNEPKPSPTQVTASTTKSKPAVKTPIESEPSTELLDEEGLEEFIEVDEPLEQAPPAPMPTATSRPTAQPTSIPTEAAQEETGLIEEELVEDEVIEEPAVEKQSVFPTATVEMVEDESGDIVENFEDYAEYEEYADEDEAVLPPETTPKELPGNVITLDPKIEFYFAKDLIKASSLSELSRLAETLNAHPDSPLIVQGKIKSFKWLPILKTLSRARANSVLRHLIVNEKIPQINVTAIGEGDSYPDLSGQDEDLPVLLVIIK